MGRAKGQALVSPAEFDRVVRNLSVQDLALNKDVAIMSMALPEPVPAASR